MSETVTKQEKTMQTEGKKNGRKKMSVKDLTTLGLLTGILLVMSFTPLGYFHTLGVDISLMMIPVAIGAMVMGPKAGAWLGFIFGATSFYQAVTGTSVFSATLFNISPFGTFLLCIPTRILMGFLTGVIFLIVQKIDRRKTACYFIGGFFAAFLNTLFFMGALILLFWNTEYIQSFNQVFGNVNPFVFVVMFVGVNGALEMPASCLAGGVVSKAVSRTLYKKVV
ncbi:MAG: ECF transporter S component [Bacillota bacterium]|nr:ECF transporter S component [Bacillota bacterium]